MSSKRQRLTRRAEKLNRQFPVGAQVRVTRDSGDIIHTTVRHPFTVLGGHTVVGWFFGIVGCYDAGRVSPPEEQ